MIVLRDRNLARDMLQQKLLDADGYLAADIRNIIDSHDNADAHDPKGVVYAVVEAMVDFAIATTPGGDLLEQAARERAALEQIAALDTAPVGECSKCHEWFGGVLMCDCESSSWEPVSPKRIAIRAISPALDGESRA
jgi:hypothetical protein